jgi:hypothetical protein
MTENEKYHLWTLLHWAKILDIHLYGVKCDKDSKELCFINSKLGFIYNFEIDDMKAVKLLCDLCCLWSNLGIESKVDADGKSVFNFEPGDKVNTG